MIPKRKLYRRVLFVALILFCFLAIAYNLKSKVFRIFLNRQIEKAESRFDINISYDKARLRGLSNFEFHGLHVHKNDSSIVASIAYANANIPLRRWLRLDLKPARLIINSLSIELNVPSFENIYDIQSIHDISTFSDKPKSSPSFDKDKGGISEFRTHHLYNALKGVAIIVATRVEINDLNFIINTPKQGVSLSAEQILSIHGEFSTDFLVSEGNSKNIISITGEADNKGNNLSYLITGDNSISIPLLEEIIDLSCSFDTIHLLLNVTNRTKSLISLNGTTSVKGFRAFHPQLWDKEVNLALAELSLDATVAPTFINVDSTSWVLVNDLKIPFSGRFDQNESLRAQLNINSATLLAASIFESLPRELFPTLEGVRVSGNTSLEMLLDIDFANPESLNFFGKLTPEDFKLLALGNTDFSRLNDTFTFHIYHNDSIVKSIPLNDEHRYFRRLDAISPHLRNAVIVAEDGGFYSHKGFDPHGFSYALARNVKERRLGRGGSTITMQLVKNLYLNQSKNIGRKAEEALIVWLIETQGLVSKDRILEIYLNIINWGPNINGIAEAAEFYFAKDPLEIELNEAIFLASIIPRPAQFSQQFDSFGNLRPHMESYFSFIGGIMLERDMITKEELEGVKPNVILFGDAANYIEIKSVG